LLLTLDHLNVRKSFIQNKQELDYHYKLIFEHY